MPLHLDKLVRNTGSKCTNKKSNAAKSKDDGNENGLKWNEKTQNTRKKAIILLLADENGLSKTKKKKKKSMASILPFPSLFAAQKGYCKKSKKSLLLS